MLWCGRNTVADTIEDHGFFGLWAMTGDRIIGGMFRHRDDIGTVDAERCNSDGDISTAADAAIIAINSRTIETRVRCNGDGLGSNPGPITNGWRFDVTGYTADVVFNVLLFGGDDYEANTVERRILDPTQDFPHGLSKTDRVLGITYFGQETAFGGTRTRGSVYNSIGMFATNDGGTTIQQWGAGQREVNGTNAQTIVGSFSQVSSVAASNREQLTVSDVQTREAQVSAIDGTNVEMTKVYWDVVPPTEPIVYMWVMSIPASMNVWVGDYVAQTSGGTFTPASQPGFTPGVYGAMATGHTVTNNYQIVDGGGAWSFGAQDENTNHRSASIIAEGNMLSTENSYAKTLTSTKLLDLVTASGSSATTACSWPSATFTASGIEVPSPLGTFGGYIGAFAFELENTGAPIDVSAADSLVLADAAPVASVEFNQTITEALSLLDEIVGQGPIVETLIENLNLIDVAAVVTPFFYTATDNLVFTDLAEPSGIVPAQGVGQRGGRTFDDVRAMRAAERLQVLARQDRELLEFLKRSLTKL